MSIEQVGAWRTSDGQLHDKADKAKEHEFSILLEAWFESACCQDDDGFRYLTLDRLVQDRTKLKAIFGELNGGSTVVKSSSSALAQERSET